MSCFIVSILHTIVIFMSKEAKTCNTIFSRQQQKELNIKSINIFDLNVWMVQLQTDRFLLWVECL